MSQLLHRLDERLRFESDLNVRAELLAQRAGYLSRVGRFDEARTIISEVRSSFGNTRDGRATVQVMLAEGLALHFEFLGAETGDRLARAHLLAQAMRDRELTAITSAWRAHLSFEASDWQLTSRFLLQAFQNSEQDNHSALARCALVLFNAFALCGDRRESQYWFMKGRDHALKQGDQATIDALLYSRAAFGAAWLRAQRSRGLVQPNEIALARREVNSARNLQNLTRVDAHSRYIDLCDARLRTIDGDYQGAIDLLTVLREDGLYPRGHFSQPLVDLELAYCRVQLGHKSADSLTPSSGELAWIEELDIDDRLGAAWMVAELSRVDGASELSESASRRLAAAVADYEAWLLELRTHITSFAGH